MWVMLGSVCIVSSMAWPVLLPVAGITLCVACGMCVALAVCVCVCVLCNLCVQPVLSVRVRLCLTMRLSHWRPRPPCGKNSTITLFRFLT